MARPQSLQNTLYLSLLEDLRVLLSLHLLSYCAKHGCLRSEAVDLRARVWHGRLVRMLGRAIAFTLLGALVADVGHDELLVGVLWFDVMIEAAISNVCAGYLNDLLFVTLRLLLIISLAAARQQTKLLKLAGAGR